MFYGNYVIISAAMELKSQLKSVQCFCGDESVAMSDLFPSVHPFIENPLKLTFIIYYISVLLPSVPGVSISLFFQEKIFCTLCTLPK